MRRLAGIAIVIALLSAGCGDSEPSARQLELAVVEADWQCEVGRRAFVDLSDIDSAHATFLAERGVSEAEARGFAADLPSTPALREAVATAYTTECGSPS